MNRNGKRFSMWYFLEPLVINWLVGIIVVMITSVVYVMVNAGQFLKVTTADAAREMILDHTKELERYTTEVTAVAALIMIPVALFMMHRDFKRNAATKNPPVKVKRMKYIFILIMSGAMCIGLNNLIILSNISALSSTYQKAAENFYSPGFLVELLCLGVIVPISEELIYRGLVFKRLKSVWPVRRSILVSALIFGLFHNNVVQFVYAVVLGAVFAFLYETYGSVKAPILAHITINISAVVGTEFKFFEWMFSSPLRVGIITVLCGTIASTMYVLMQEKYYKNVK